MLQEEKIIKAELIKTHNFQQEWEDIKWFSKDTSKNLQWIDQFCTIEEKDEKVLVWVDPRKCFEAQLDTIPKLEEAFDLFSTFVREAGRRGLVTSSSVENSHMVEPFYMKYVYPLYKDVNKVIITKNLEVFTQSTALAKKQSLVDGEKYIGPLKAWTKWDVKERKGILYYRGIIQNPKAVNKSSSWMGDREYLKESGYEIRMRKSIQKIISGGGAIQEGKYKKVKILRHKKSGGGIMVSLYWLVSEDIIKRMTENCSVKVNNNYDKETGRGDSETQYFIKPAEPFVRGDQIRFQAYYFTVPQIERFFKKRGYKVVISKRLLEEQTFKKLPFKLRLRYHPHSKKVKCGKVCKTMISAKYKKKKKQMYLWEHQSEAISNWQVNGDLGTIAIPTGGGKTLCLIDAVRQLNTWSLFLVPTIELKDQLIETIVKRLGVPRDQIGEFWGEKKEIKPITVGLLQSAHKVTKEKSTMTAKELEKAEKFIKEFGDISKEFGFLGVDEGHHLPAPVWKLSGIHIKTFKRMSCTATPERDDMNEPLLYFMMGDVVYRCGYGDLAEKGIVCPIDYQRVICKLEQVDKDILENLYVVRARNEYGQYVYARPQQSQAKRDLLDLFHKKNRYGIAKAKGMNTILYTEPKRLNIQPRYVHGFSEAKFAKLKEIFAKHKNDRTLIFQQFVAGADCIKKFLDEEFPECKEKVRIITGETKYTEREDAFTSFKLGKINTIITTTVLDEGIDVPDCSVIIIMNGTSSPRQTIQRIGRGCRRGKNKIESVYELVSYGQGWVDKSEYWRLPWAERIRHDIFCAEQTASVYRNPEYMIKPSIQKTLIKRIRNKEMVVKT